MFSLIGGAALLMAAIEHPFLSAVVASALVQINKQKK